VEFQTSFWKKNCLINSKIAKENLYFMVLGYTSKKSQKLGNPYAWKFLMSIFELVGRFFFQNDSFNLQEEFKEFGIRVILENGIGSFQTFLILQIWDKPQMLKRFQKQFWKLDSKPRETTHTLVFVNYIGLFPKPFNKSIFSVFGRCIEY
jgi:hypothetical protein